MIHNHVGITPIYIFTHVESLSLVQHSDHQLRMCTDPNIIFDCQL